jgi:hypothetical protein
MPEAFSNQGLGQQIRSHETVFEMQQERGQGPVGLQHSRTMSFQMQVYCHTDKLKSVMGGAR